MVAAPSEFWVPVRQLYSEGWLLDVTNTGPNGWKDTFDESTQILSLAITSPGTYTVRISPLRSRDGLFVNTG